MVMAWWPLSYLKSQDGVLDSPGLVVLDDSIIKDNKKLRLDWRRWLQVFNTLQTLKGFRMASLLGIQNKDLELLHDKDTGMQTASPAQPSQMAWALEWQDIVSQSLSTLASGLRVLADAQITPPVVGYEITNVKGQVTADAELAWPTKQLVVLRSDQDDLVPIWEAASWHVVLLDKDGLNVQTQSWHRVVLAKLSV